MALMLLFIVALALICVGAAAVMTGLPPGNPKPLLIGRSAELKSLLGFYKMGYEDGKNGIPERNWYDISTVHSNFPMPTTFEKGVRAYRLGFMEGRDGLKNRVEILELSAETEQKFLQEVENFKSSSHSSQLNSSQF